MNQSRVPLKSKNVLEWGCGCGGILYQFKKILSCSVVGFDLNKRSAETGMQLSAGHITILNNLVNNVIKRSFFDIIILSHSLEHFPCPESDLKKILTFLKKGGHIYIELPGIDNSRVYNHNYTAQPGHLNIFSIKSLTSLCDNLNLEKVSINKKIQSIFCKR
jgi:2-polyprenyl-3-methyl-5-hydroxy-6-metoxy-1,4-benzoquinol methylase